MHLPLHKRFPKELNLLYIRGQSLVLIHLIAMQEEIEILHKNRTWDLCKLPKGCCALRCKQIYKRKEGISKVEDVTWKACLVVRGFDQKEGIDFNKFFSPVVCHSFIRVLLAFVALFDLELKKLDVKTAFYCSSSNNCLH